MNVRYASFDPVKSLEISVMVNYTTDSEIYVVKTTYSKKTITKS